MRAFKELFYAAVIGAATGLTLEIVAEAAKSIYDLIRH